MGWTTPTDRTTGYVVTSTDWNIVEDDLTFLYGDAAATNVSGFTNSWAAGSPAPTYALVGRLVVLGGVMTAGTANTAAFTLPSGYRPARSAFFLVPTSGASTTANLIMISTAGVVTPLNSAQCVLSPCIFPVF